MTDPALLERIANFLGAERVSTTDLDAHVFDIEAELLLLARRRAALEASWAAQPTRWGDGELALLRSDLARTSDALCLQWGRLALERRLRQDQRPAVEGHGQADAPTQPLRRVMPSETHAVAGLSQAPPPSLPAIAVPVPQPPPRAPLPPALPPDPVAIERLKAHLTGTAGATGTVDASRRKPQSRFDAQLAKALIDELGPVPPALDKEPDARAELRRLLKAARPERFADWVVLPPDVQRALISVIASRARCLQQQPVAALLIDADAERDLNLLFSGLSGYLKREQPGFVHGLSRAHQPEGADWRHDAGLLWERLLRVLGDHHEQPTPNPERALHELDKVLDSDSPDERVPDDKVVAALQAAVDAGVAQDDPRLVRMMRPWLDLLGRHARFKVLRKTIRNERDQDAQEAAAKPNSLPVDWPWWHLTRGKRAAMVGGDPREEARTRLMQAFEMAELHWGAIDQTPQLDSLAESLRRGGWDVVVLLQSFVNHKTSNKIIDACKDGGVAFISVERGYGTERIRAAIEENLGRKSAAA
jgi:hypothetical protein